MGDSRVGGSKGTCVKYWVAHSKAKTCSSRGTDGSFPIIKVSSSKVSSEMGMDKHKIGVDFKAVGEVGLDTLTLEIGLNFYTDFDVLNGSSLKHVDDPLVLCEVDQHLGHDAIVGPGVEQMENSTNSVEVVPRLESDVIGDLSKVNFGDSSVMPLVTRPTSFNWKFLETFWALIPASVVNTDLTKKLEEVEPVDGESDSQASDNDPQEVDYGYDSMLEFERSFRELMPILQEGNSSKQCEFQMETRRSDIQKKPSSRRNEDAGSSW